LIDIQNLYRDLADEGLADQDRLIPAEVPLPTLDSRIEEWIELPAEEAGEIGSLGPVAFCTGKAEAIRVISPPVLPGDHMINVERKEISVVLVQPTVFATPACTLPDESPDSRVNH
jgi:hypothetical protein